VSGAPEMKGLNDYLSGAGFVDVCLDVKEESREVIKQWMPGSGAENYVVSANISGRKPLA
jgi:arsenite methyltransferase